MALASRSLLQSKPFMVAMVLSGLIAAWGIQLVTPKGALVDTVPVIAPSYDAFEGYRGHGCDAVLQQHGMVAAVWSSSAWISLASCFEAQKKHGFAASAAAGGLSYFPQHEVLHNIRGYHLIEQGEHEKAVAHLRAALQSVTPTDHVLENNLAWAGLFVPEKMTVGEARRHYRSAMMHGVSCELLHTGMWVEYAVAVSTNGTQRDAAITQYQQLRAKYAPCTGRWQNGTKHTAYEVAGAGILDVEIHKLQMVQRFERNEIIDGFAPLHSALVERTVRAMNLSPSDVAAACDEIAPVNTAKPACLKALTAAR